jgi:hypothetical protein
MRIERIKNVRDGVLGRLYQSPHAAIVEEFFHRGARVYVLGGAVRDAIAADFGRPSEFSPRDFDVGVSGVDATEFEDVVSGVGRKNRHGGFVLAEPGQPTWDIWRLENSIGLRKTGTLFSLENVLRSFNLDCNATALDIRTGLVYDLGAVDSIRREQVGLVKGVIRHSFRTFAAKALLSQIRFGYSASQDVARQVQRYLEEKSLLHESRKAFPNLEVIGPYFFNP